VHIQSGAQGEVGIINSGKDGKAGAGGATSPRAFSYYVSRAYPSLRPACFRADNPIAIRHRIASERDRRPGSPTAPFIDVLSPLQPKPNTGDWSLSGPRATAPFSYYKI
jgi:hypothetical protein